MKRKKENKENKERRQESKKYQPAPKRENQDYEKCE
jgi:hypothetical protein